MPDIFISYSSRDRDRVSRLAEALGAKGFNVWWDSAGLNAGDSWRKEIEHHLRAAKAVIVCWSRAANDSRWVLQEAEEAVRARRLIPVLIEDVEPPFGFRETQALDLVPWLTRRDEATFSRLLAAIDRINGAPARANSAPPARPARPTPPPAPPPPPLAPSKFKVSPALIIASVAVLFVGGWGVSRLLSSRTETAANSQQTVENTERPAETSVVPAVQIPPEPVVETPRYPVCDPGFSLECLRPLVRRAVEEARRNAAEADDARARATVAQAAGQEAARRARQGLSGFEVEAASSSRREVALFEGMALGGVFNAPRSKYATLRYQPSDDRDRYEGEWSYANAQGRAPVGVGAMTYRSGGVYYGTFVDGRPNGMGVLEYADGTVESGLWVNGQVSSYVYRTAAGAPRIEGSTDFKVYWTPEGQISFQQDQ